MDEAIYDDIADEDLIEAFSHASPILPALTHPDKRQRINDERQSENGPDRHRRGLADSYEYDSTKGDNQGNQILYTNRNKTPDTYGRNKLTTYSLGGGEAEVLTGSNPWRLKGPPNKRAKLGHTAELPGISTILDRPSILENSFQTSKETASPDYHFNAELEGLPSDAFSSPEPHPVNDRPISINSSSQTNQAVLQQQQIFSQPSLRQTTLFSGIATENERPAQKAQNNHIYKVDQAPEVPTHHALDPEALKTWVYPMNLGTIRDYQYSIVKNGLFHNLLVALPTGLGKTFIAATIMLNYFRWTRSAQIVFVAPTKPLVSQQVDACFNIVGIPKSETTMLTGEQIPALRAEEWGLKRVFFMTPQTLENDLASGIADSKKIVLLVVDEAHRATGNYSYVRVVSFLRRFNKSFRVLALTATPGSSVEAVQEVIDNLEISKVEIRTEESLDIQRYVHKRNIDQILLDPSEEMIMIKELLAKALQPLVNTLCTGNAYWNRDPMALTTFGMIKARTAWMQSDAGKRANPGLKAMMNSLFAVLASVAHSIKLLNFHGISPFYSTIKDFRDGDENSKKPGKYRTQIINSPDFKKMMDTIQSWLNTKDFIGHPKMIYLCDTILNHFLDAGDGKLGENEPPSATRVIVFAEYRDSAEDIARVLNRHGPLIRASVFVGQADSKRSEGMNQKKQIKAIQDFSSGKFNVIVATSIGEEGLDIGQVDLIVCYDSSASPIRMLQRMGRTGRKRAGKIVLLLMKGKEEESFTKAKDNYEQMQKMISSGTRFNLRYDLSVRIIPRDITPLVDKRIIEVPIENTQNPGLPEPRRRPIAKKKPAKKFSLPDGVETSFTMASKLGEGRTVRKADKRVIMTPKSFTKQQLATVPSVKLVFLDSDEEEELEQKYQNIKGDDMQEVSMPEMTVQTVSQRSLRPVGNIAHGHYTKRYVELFKILARSQRPEDRDLMPYGDKDSSVEYLDPPTLIDESKLRIRSKALTAPRQPKLKPPKSVSKKKLAEQVLIEAEESDCLSSVNFEQGFFDELELSGDNNSEGEGEDLMVSSELSGDNSDHGEDLRDFIDDSSSQVRFRSNV